MSPGGERGAVIEIPQPGSTRHFDRPIDGGFAEIDDEVGRRGVRRGLAPDPVDQGMRQAFGQFDGPDGFQRLRRGNGEQRDPAADDPAVGEGGGEVVRVTPVGDHPVTVALAAVGLQDASEIGAPGGVRAVVLPFQQSRGQVGIHAPVEVGGLAFGIALGMRIAPERAGFERLNAEGELAVAHDPPPFRR